MVTEARPGQVIGGRYRLLADLGSGGFGRVWRARDEYLRVDVAVKELRLFTAMRPTERSERVARAAREARNAARLRDHAGIVTVHDVVVADGLPWIVMQLVDGTSLQARLDAHGALSDAEAAAIAATLLDALGAAHRAGIVHRDVKPANVLITEDGRALLTDFGIAVQDSDTALTATGAVLGSVEYMAPERVRGTDGLAASDLFSLGVTLYQAVEGVSPFRRDTPTGSLTAVLFDEPPPPRRAGRLTPLITGLLAKDPDRRLTVAAALALLPGTEPTTAAPPFNPTTKGRGAPDPATTPTAPRTPPPFVPARLPTPAPRRNRMRAAVSLLVAGLVIAAAVALTTRDDDSTPHADATHTATAAGTESTESTPASPPPTAGPSAVPPQAAPPAVPQVGGEQAPDRVTVRVAAEAKTWVSVTDSTGRQLFEGVLESGQSETFTAASELHLVIGNAAALRLTVNGKDLGPASTTPSVVRLTFTPEDPTSP